MSEVSDRLKKSRKEVGLKQAQIESMTGFRQSDVSKWENGTVKNIPSEYMLFLHNHGVNINYIYSGQGNVLVEQGAEPAINKSIVHNPTEKGTNADIFDLVMKLKANGLNESMRSQIVDEIIRRVAHLSDENGKLKTELVETLKAFQKRLLQTV